MDYGALDDHLYPSLTLFQACIASRRKDLMRTKVEFNPYFLPESTCDPRIASATHLANKKERWSLL
jgi:hypothetical protein